MSRGNRWTPEEFQNLVALIEQHGHDYDKIAENFGQGKSRSDICIKIANTKYSIKNRGHDFG